MGTVVDGCPAGLELTEETLRAELARDIPDPLLGTGRGEPNEAELLSGVFEGLTLGTPISILIRNAGVQSEFYRKLKDKPRPGHADLTYRLRYGHVDWRGGSRASGRECISRLAAAAVARALLGRFGIAVSSRVIELAGISIGTTDDLDRARTKAVAAKKQGDSTGGMVQIAATGVPGGIGAPVFDKLEADLARAILGIGGVKSFASGAGCGAAAALGSGFNDELEWRDGKVASRTNRAGGVLGGISTGEAVWFQFKVKPTPSINLPQQTVDLASGSDAVITSNGHFDANFTPRAAVVAEAMTCLVLADHLLESGCIHPTRLDQSPLLRDRGGPRT